VLENYEPQMIIILTSLDLLDPINNPAIAGYSIHGKGVVVAPFPRLILANRSSAPQWPVGRQINQAELTIRRHP
jgi:hypothetical protein